MKRLAHGNQEITYFSTMVQEQERRTFINNRLAKIAKEQRQKILQLEPRLLLKKQQRKDADSSVIDVESYQAIDSIARFDQYSIIVLDECHYLFQTVVLTILLIDITKY